MADVSIDDAVKEEWDLVALPGGMPGAEHLRDSAPLIQLLEKQNKAGKMYGAVCASPAVVLASNGLVTEGATCYPAPVFRDSLTNPVDDDVVVKDNLTTSKGPGTSLKFALMLGEQMYGKEKADFKVTAKIDRRNWGLNWNIATETSGFIVSDYVNISCDVELLNLGERALVMEFEPVGIQHKSKADHM